jgi:uncharacterized membrane protein YebE (DUF533 family)
MSWADGKLDDREKDGVRGAAEVLNLNKETRDRLEKLMAVKSGVEDLSLGKLTPREGAFAYVAAAWMAGIDEDVADKERAMLDKVAEMLKLDAKRQSELEAVAKQLEPLPDGKRNWSEEITKLLRAIPPHLEAEPSDDFEVVFEGDG